MNKKKRYTIAEIAAHNESAGKFYFSRKTLKFFHQTRKAFKIAYYNDHVIVYAPAYSHDNSGKLRFSHVSIAEYIPETGNVQSVSNELKQELTLNNIL